MQQHCSTALGLRVKDGVVLAVEKLLVSKMLVPNTNRRIHTVDRHCGLVRPVFLSRVYVQTCRRANPLRGVTLTLPAGHVRSGG